MQQGTIDSGPGGLVVSRARDGDILMVMDGVGLDGSAKVDVRLDGKVLTVGQGGRVHACGPVDDDLVGDLAGAAQVTVCEVFAGEGGDDVFVVHRDPRLSLPLR